MLTFSLSDFSLIYLCLYTYLIKDIFNRIILAKNTLFTVKYPL